MVRAGRIQARVSLGRVIGFLNTNHILFRLSLKMVALLSPMCDRDRDGRQSREANLSSDYLVHGLSTILNHDRGTVSYQGT